MYERDHLYIGGEWVAPVAGGRVDVVNPATEAVIGHAPLASAPDVDRAVAAARDAFEHGPWPRTAPETRADALVAMAEYLRERARPAGRAQHRRSRRADHVRARTRSWAR